MPKYIQIFNYSSGSWARMINTLGGSQSTVVQHTLESLGGSLECMYWQVGSHDGYAIFDVPDSVTAEAVEQAMTKTGAFKSIETHELLTEKQLIETLHLAREAGQVYEVPGQPD
ncbi:MAG TPA: GYD domain-containing protein [Streptosporangiaceae bacterium]|nr:GYD domain-containing protein [Streptosporangiaceae bacterium]